MSIIHKTINQRAKRWLNDDRLFIDTKEILHPMGLALFRVPESGVSDGALIAPDGKWHYADDIEKGGAK